MGVRRVARWVEKFFVICLPQYGLLNNFFSVFVDSGWVDGSVCVRLSFLEDSNEHSKIN